MSISSCSAAGSIGTSGTVTIPNSTLSGNSGGFTSNKYGGNEAPMSMLTNVTVAANDIGVTATNGTVASAHISGGVGRLARIRAGVDPPFLMIRAW